MEFLRIWKKIFSPKKVTKRDKIEKNVWRDYLGTTLIQLNIKFHTNRMKTIAARLLERHTDRRTRNKIAVDSSS